MFSRVPQLAQILHGRFEQQVAVRPRSIAVECDGVRLHYRELNAEANRLARSLVQSGVGADSLVLLSVERSCDMALSLLAVLKAGGAFVMREGAIPDGHVLNGPSMKALGAELLLTDRRAEFPGLRVVRTQDAVGSSRNLGPTTLPDRWACLAAGKVYTHHTVLGMLEELRGQFDLHAGDGMYSAAPLSGFGAVELLLPLVTGGRLVIASTHELHDAEWLAQSIAESHCKVVRAAKQKAAAASAAASILPFQRRF
jgi:non-ribosomal peptide synthetase component F